MPTLRSEVLKVIDSVLESYLDGLHEDEVREISSEIADALEIDGVLTFENEDDEAPPLGSND